MSLRLCQGPLQVKPIRAALLACALLSVFWLGRAYWHTYNRKFLFGELHHAECE